MTADAIHQSSAKSGVLLVNLGTPASPTPDAIRAYLRPFLSDPRVVELPRWLWLPILYGVILPFRPRRLVEAYRQVWTEQGSPLMCISRRQQEQLQHRIGPETPVELAMCYGQPSIASALKRLEDAGVRKVVLLPLYPQYSATTTAAVLDQFFDALKQRRWVPEIRTINQYHDEESYLSALASQIRKSWQHEGRGDHLLISFHSIPRKCLENGDPYFCQCHKTARLLADKLQLDSQDWSISFQSRIGRQPWLQPYTDRVVPQLAQQGVKQLDVVCPGFAADCLETLEEVAIRYAEDFAQAGGKRLRYIKALNDSAEHIDALATILGRQLDTDAATLESKPDPERAMRVEKVRPSLHCETLLPSG